MLSGASHLQALGMENSVVADILLFHWGITSLKGFVDASAHVQAMLNGYSGGSNFLVGLMS